MDNEVANMSGVQDIIEKRMKAEFALLIPDEMWAKMVEAVVVEFVSDVKGDQWGNNKKDAPIKRMIRAELDALAKAKMRQELDELSAGAWDKFGKKVASEAIVKLIDDHFPELLASVQKSMVSMAVEQALNHMRNSYTR